MFNLSNTTRNFRSCEILPPVYKYQKKNSIVFSNQDKFMFKEKLGKHYYQSLKFQEALEVLNARAKLTIDQRLQKHFKKKQIEEQKLKELEKKDDAEYYYDVKANLYNFYQEQTDQYVWIEKAEKQDEKSKEIKKRVEKKVSRSVSNLKYKHTTQKQLLPFQQEYQEAENVYYDKWYIPYNQRFIPRARQLQIDTKQDPYALNTKHFYNNIHNFEAFVKFDPFEKNLPKDVKDLIIQSKRVESLKEMLKGSRPIYDFKQY